ncbi:hypothetical protein CYMTET_22119 [Cymbomonas tetramitiformis]|uniref:Uncharacterized protein n=1 Tax=Cymbomonas tetramitiformis TaxID=36881 RepID=A0AAE0G0P3_9CHLO|nr:hypothetical protein CYMTET_22119 [Cymbomonas tetramitiformis]
MLSDPYRAPMTCDQPVDALVMNFGAHYASPDHYPSYSAHHLAQLVEPDHTELVMMLDRFPQMHKLYRELAPSHGLGNLPCQQQPAGRANGTIGRYVLGANTTAKMAQHGIIFMEVFDMMRLAWRQHASPTDCLHWAIPGPISAWVTAMIDAIYCRGR